MGDKINIGHRGTNWLHHPCRVCAPQHFIPGDKMRSGPQKGTLATIPMPSGGSPTHHSSGQNQKWPTSGPIGAITPFIQGATIASKWGRKPRVTHKQVHWLHDPCCFGGPQRFKMGDTISSGPQVG